MTINKANKFHNPLYLITFHKSGNLRNKLNILSYQLS